MNWTELLIQQSINGLTRGSIFALISLGYTMVYGVIELINFAHGDIFMLGLMVSLTFLVDVGLARPFGGWELVTLLPLILVGTMIITGGLNLLVDRIAYRPLRHAPRLVPLISAIGVSFMLENLTLVWKGPYVLSYPDLFPSIDIIRDVLHIDSQVYVSTKDLLVVGLTIPLIYGLHLFVTRTSWGKAMRAAAQDRETAEAMGIDVEKIIMLTFFVGGALAGAAGVIQGIYYNIGQWWMGYQAGLRAFTAAVLGGIGNMPGAALGGYLIGFLSAWSDQFISPRWTNAVVFSILILVLVFRPHGLLGERAPEKH